MSKEEGSQIIEHGDIFFFYRPKVGTEEVADPQGIIGVIDKLPDREYENMADVEKSVGQVL